MRARVPPRSSAGPSRAEDSGRSTAAPAASGRLPAAGTPTEPWAIAEDRARRFGHRALELPPPAAATGAPIQRVVRKVRGKGGGWRSTLTGKTYAKKSDADKADAEAAEVRKAEQRVPRAPRRAKEKEGEEVGPPAPPKTPISALLARFPAHLGPLGTPSGDVLAEDVAKAAKEPQIQRPRGEKDVYSHSGRNTYAAITSGLEVGGETVGQSLFSAEGEELPAEEIESQYPAKTKLRDFRDKFILAQGAPPQGVTLPKSRKTAHAEALGVHSQGFKKAAQKSAQQADYLVEQLGGLPELGDDPSDESLEQLSQILGPDIRSRVGVVENRFSCGHRGGSGYRGGCTSELAEQAPKISEEFVSALSKPSSEKEKEEAPEVGEEEEEEGLSPRARVGAYQSLGILGPTLSTAGDYTKRGNPDILRRAGFDLQVHNRFDFGGRGGLAPFTAGQESLEQQFQPGYEADVDPTSRNESEVAEEEVEKGGKRLRGGGKRKPPTPKRRKTKKKEKD